MTDVYVLCTDSVSMRTNTSTNQLYTSIVLMDRFLETIFYHPEAIIFIVRVRVLVGYVLRWSISRSLARSLARSFVCSSINSM